VKILYFAWLRNKVGCAEEELTPPADVATVADLVAWLATQSSGHANALADMQVVRCAVDQEYVGLEHVIGAAREVAFFPPVTGGD
jgi:molybdopterin synthase sulfur carrier subunit